MATKTFVKRNRHIKYKQYMPVVDNTATSVLKKTEKRVVEDTGSKKRVIKPVEPIETPDNNNEEKV
jgi:hypothetical protein